MTPDYNNIAHRYDRLAKLVFGNKLESAKKANIEHIKPGHKVLVVGGGTGSILEYIAELGRKNVIDFVDVSDQMIQIARQREIIDNRVSFYPVKIEEFEISDYDIIITNFFFDQFSQDKTEMILAILKQKLSRNGLVLFSDFLNPTSVRNRIIHTLMKLYFRFTINLKVKQYPDYQKAFYMSGLKQISSKLVGGNILVEVYSK